MRKWKVILIAVLLASAALAAGEKWTDVPAAAVKGEPAQLQASGDAIYVWSSPQGLHLRWKAGQLPRLFTGKIDTDGKIQEVVRMDRQGGGWARTHGDRRVLFSATVRPGMTDGIDVLTSSQRADLVLDMDDQPPSPRIVFLGKDATSPAALPLRLRLK